MISAQGNLYYYFNGEKEYLTMDKSKFNITVTADFQPSSIAQFNFKEFDMQEDFYCDSSLSVTLFGKLEFLNAPSDAVYH